MTEHCLKELCRGDRAGTSVLLQDVFILIGRLCMDETVGENYYDSFTDGFKNPYKYGKLSWEELPSR